MTQLPELEYRIAVRRTWFGWRACVKGFGVAEWVHPKWHRSRTREGAIAKAERECDRMEARRAAREAPDVVEYRPGSVPAPPRSQARVR